MMELLYFTAPYCGPCKQVKPVLDEFAAAYKDVIVTKVNIEENLALANQYGIRTIPSFVVIFEGEVVKNQSGGIRTVQDLETLVGK